MNEHRCEETNDDPGVARNDKRRLDYNKESCRKRYLKQKGGITAAAACHERCGDLSQAKAEYLAAFTFNPQHVDALFGLAVCFQKQGDLTGAEDELPLRLTRNTQAAISTLPFFFMVDPIRSGPWLIIGRSLNVNLSLLGGGMLRPVERFA